MTSAASATHMLTNDDCRALVAARPAAAAAAAATVAATAAAAAGEGAGQSMSSVEARQQQAQVELLTLLVAGGRRAVIGVIGVAHRPGRPFIEPRFL